MKKISLKAILGISGLTLLTVGVAVDGNILNLSNLGLKLSRASSEPYTTTLNNSNSPTLSSGSGTMVDDKGVTWEYSGCANYASGHITLNHNGYCGVSSSSQYGYTHISKITADFTSSEGDELWLLKSIDGTNWSEEQILESNTGVTAVNNWRYIRLYNYSENENSISINSVQIEFGCLNGKTTTEDVDLANVDNVTNSTGVTYTKETTTLSPANDRDSIEAINIVKNGTTNYVDFTLDRIYTVENLYARKVEFDYYHKNNSNKPSLVFISKGVTKGSTQSYSGSRTNYKVSNLDPDWWHIEISTSSMVALYVDHGDTATSAPNGINAIRLITGNCIIDNLRIGLVPSQNDNEVGLFNNGYSINMSDRIYYWFKVCWYGKLHSCVYTFDSPIAEQDDSPNSRFYIKALATGNVTVTATLVVGYNRNTVHVSKQIEI